MNENNNPRFRRLIEYCKAHSPFQKLIDSLRKRHRLSGRELAEKIGVSQSTLWVWLHNVNGFPHPNSFNSEHVRRLADVLSLSESEIKTALDASRPFDAFGRFIEILENDNRQTVSKPYVLNIAKNLYRCSK
jgi:transcriptional regulator with XRE-family HTH domain